MVFYRKYRPQNIEELDSEAIRNTLNSVLAPFAGNAKGENSPHAFLFTGPKGLGKTSTARIIAKVINCQNKKEESIEPCNKCEQCKSIINGSNIDILEIDGASNRGIDEIRDLREKIKLSPAYASKKVYIIDEVHMLTTEAFNALLKTLEEPPSHAIFILCTTEPHKVPETISSRCFQIGFKLATKEELIRSFKRITANEKVKIDDEALAIIASLSDGSFRDGTKILDELVTIANGGKITKALVEEKYHIASTRQQVSKMMEVLAKKDIKSGLLLTEDLVKQGVDIKFFIDQILERIHLILLKKAGVEIQSGENLDSQSFTFDDLRELGALIQRAAFEVKGSVLPQLPLELLIVSWCNQESGGVTETKNEPEKTELPKEAGRKEETKSTKNSVNGDIWQMLIDKVKGNNHSLAGVLRGVSLKSFDKKEVIIETGFKFHKEKLDDPGAKQLIKNAYEEITGEKVSVTIQLIDRK